MSDEIQVPVWYSNGHMMLRRDALEVEHQESTYNYIKNVLKKNPEDYGYHNFCLLPEQSKLLSTIPTEVLYAELDRRDIYGDW